MFHRDQTDRFGAGNTSEPHRIAVFTAPLPILSATLAGIQPRRPRQNRERPNLILCPTTLPNCLDIHPIRGIL